MNKKHKLKVYVYAIAKNESKFVDKWVDSMSEADGIYVMVDASSSDNTEALLKKRKVHVEKKIISPWRFDVARNESLKLVPKNADVCVCTDLDEIFSPGWRDVIEQKWIKGVTNQATYKFWHNAGTKNAVPSIFEYSKIHDRNTFSWKWAVHEYIVQKDPNQKINFVNLDGVMLYHYPDLSKPRSYKKLLQDALKTEPDDLRYQQLLAEEYINANELEEASKILDKLISHPTSSHPYDVSIAYKLACQVEEKRQNYGKIKSLCYEALSKIDTCRWFYAELGDVLINQFKDYEFGISMMEKALSITQVIITARETEWQNEARIYCDISIAYFYLKKFDKAIESIDKAIEKNVDPAHNETYVNNKKIYENALKNNQQ